MRVLFVGNHGGRQVCDIHSALGCELARHFPDLACHFAVWERWEADYVRKSLPAAQFSVLADFLAATVEDDWRLEVDRIARDYPGVNWSEVIASERCFTDYSFLLGGAGHRHEPADYATRLIVDQVRFLERVLETSRPDVMICQTADTLFSHVAFKVFGARGIPTLAISPAWLQEGGMPGSFITRDEYMRCDRMIAAYARRIASPLTADEVERVERFREEVVHFDGNKAFYAARKKSFGRSAWSPNLGRLPQYLAQNRAKDPRLHYTRIDAVAKAKANVLRVWRKWRAKPLLGSTDIRIPQRSVFFALHFQPEQSTLVGGIYHANQVALVENLSKALPFGWTLVLKEHPAGRGTRPVWQYRHMASLPNVMFCDAPSKAIAREVEAVVTITGTIGIEAVALGKPVVMLGRSFFGYGDLIYRPQSVSELPDLFRRLLIEREHEKTPGRPDLQRKYLLSYLDGLYPVFPKPENAAALAAALAGEVRDALGGGG